MISQIEFSLEARNRGCHLITNEVISKLPKLPENGILNLFIKHTSCALTINENFDPSVRSDMENIFNKLIREGEYYYQHIDEGDDDMPSHFKSSMFGVSLVIPITNHSLNLGTWQGIYLCEFRNYGGTRHVVATIYQ